jgi:hypothetical protein
VQLSHGGAPTGAVLGEAGGEGLRAGERRCRLRLRHLPPMPCSRLRRSARMGEVRLAGWGVVAGLVRFAACSAFTIRAPGSIPISERYAARDPTRSASSGRGAVQ